MKNFKTKVSALTVLVLGGIAVFAYLGNVKTKEVASVVGDKCLNMEVEIRYDTFSVDTHYIWKADLEEYSVVTPENIKIVYARISEDRCIVGLIDHDGSYFSTDYIIFDNENGDYSDFDAVAIFGGEISFTIEGNSLDFRFNVNENDAYREQIIATLN